METLYAPARISNRMGEAPEGLPESAFYRQMEISSTRLDSHFTHMMPSTLQNFIDAAKEGRAFLDSHDGRKLGIGYTIGGELATEGEILRAMTGFYTMPGINFGGQHSFASTDDYIRAVEAQIVRDVSVGFYGGTWVCDVCGGDYRSYRTCPHWAGSMVEVHDEAGDPEMVRVTVAIHDGELSEVSAVYDGSTPGAMIRKAQDAAREGAIDEKQRSILEVRYKVALPEHDRAFKGVDLTHKQTGPEAGEEKPAAREGRLQDEVPEMETVELTLSDVRAILTRQGYEGAEAVATADDVLAALNWSNDELSRLRPLADTGTAYRADLIDEALAEGVRAQGEKFPSETYRDMLANASLDHIKQVRDQFAEQAGERLPSGRQTEDGGEAQPTETRLPDAAYVS